MNKVKDINQNHDLIEYIKEDKIYIAMLEERVQALETELKELKFDYEELDNDFNSYVLASIPVGTEH